MSGCVDDNPVHPRHPVDEGSVEAIFLASKALLGVVARSIAPTLENITLPQLRVLVVLRTTGPIKMSALAQWIAVQPSTFSRTVDRLVAKGLVIRQPSEDSRREILVAATPQGTELVDAVAERRRNELRQILAILAPADQAEMALILGRFADAAGEPRADTLLTLGI